MFTSGDYADVIIPQIADCIRRFDELPPITHIGSGRRRSILEIARESRPDVEPITLAELERAKGVRFPRDTSFSG